MDAIRTRLAVLGTPDRAVNEKRYLKSNLEFLGVRVPEVRRAAKAWLREVPDLNRDELLAVAAELWSREVHELRAFAIELLIERGELLRRSDIRLLEGWLREAKTWAHVDPISARIVGSLFGRFPSVGRTLDRWANDDDFWIRRSALLAGSRDWERFARYADGMLEETEFFIRKAIGWMLRETSKREPDRVYRFLAQRIDRVSGLTLREGSRRLPEGQQAALAAARSG